MKQCQSVLTTFIARQNDPEYIKYIRQSNANCAYASQAVCCPREAPVTQAPPTSPPVDETPIARPNSGVASRLLLPSEGCGVSKVPHNRVVGGVPAKKGDYLRANNMFQVHWFLSSGDSLTQFSLSFLQEGKSVVQD